MALIANIVTPFGAAIAHHEIVRVEGLMADAFLMAVVHSWPTAEDCAAHGGNGATSVLPVALPIENILAEVGTWQQRCEKALISHQHPDNPFTGASLAPSVTDVDTAKAARWANIKQTRQLLNTAPFLYKGYEVDATPASNEARREAVLAMRETNQPVKLWRCADNVMRELTLADLVDISIGIEARRQRLMEISDTLYKKLQDPATRTVADVEKIVWPVVNLAHN